VQEKNKPLLTTCAVGDFYVNEVLEFLNTEFSKDFNIHVLTDKPHMFKNVTVDLYEKTTFNYFDKFIYGINKIQQYNSSVLMYDADILEWLEGDINNFDFNSDVIQFSNTWHAANTFGKLKFIELNGISFFDFFQNILKKENIDGNNITLVHEDKMFFPLQDYTEFLKYFTSLLKPFTENSYKFWGHKGAVGNGEGVAIGYALFKSNLPYRVINYSST